ncbi:MULTISPECIES: glutathione S-transferase [Gulbenkiania]|uniref:glutathione transferase n=1 Tax=Gulbenkiania indica TaxID=375574 RepID=A0A0K6GVG2_9NEIS|nr:MULTISPECIES: glutathione S-transferase [Gulbenkiania]CUA82741.1 Glutathione S-transferase [Gulbenkiania indica]
MLTVHHLNNSRSQRILWLLEELGVPYEIRPYQRNPETLLAPRTLKGVHPLGKAPVVTDGDITVAESGAIIEYLVDTYGAGRLKPAVGTPARRQYTYWLHYAEGSLMPLLLMKLVFSRLSHPPMPVLLRPMAGMIARSVSERYLQPQLAQHFAHIETSLATSGWFAGDELTAADIQMSFPLEAAAASMQQVERYPAIRAFLTRIRDRPAYQRALEKGGEYGFALRSPD